jgi:hypothetical protein
MKLRHSFCSVTLALSFTIIRVINYDCNHVYNFHIPYNHLLHSSFTIVIFYSIGHWGRFYKIILGKLDRLVIIEFYSTNLKRHGLQK